MRVVFVGSSLTISVTVNEIFTIGTSLSPAMNHKASPLFLCLCLVQPLACGF